MAKKGVALGLLALGLLMLVVRAESDARVGSSTRGRRSGAVGTLQPSGSGVDADAALLQLQSQLRTSHRLDAGMASEAAASASAATSVAAAAAVATATVAGSGVLSSAEAQIHSPCPNACSNNGYCIGGRKCRCHEGWTGEDCSKSFCANDCSGHGDCVDGRCICNKPWAGVDCSFKGCGDACNNNGLCDIGSGDCICFPGFHGTWCQWDMDAHTQHSENAHRHDDFMPKLSKPCPLDCSDRGICDDGKCWCYSNYTTIDCSQTVCENQCSGHGECDGTTGTCRCREGWRGNDCGWKQCKSDCNGHGKCTREGVCQCDEGFYGSDCNPMNCMHDCSGHGVCLQDLVHQTKKCGCAEGWMGEDCSEVRCLKDCNGNGKCRNGKCECKPGFFGLDCSPLNCPSDCNKRGVCVMAPGSERPNCACNRGWEGPACEYKSVTCPKDCRGNGDCNLNTGKCKCHPGFVGKSCKPLKCKHDCNQHGSCKVDIVRNTAACVCDQDHVGEYCDHLSWHGVETREKQQKERKAAAARAKRVPCPDDCSGNGKCNFKTGICKCYPGYFGLNCAPQNCAKQCSKHGVCLVPKGQLVGYCACEAGWMGETCHEKTCFDCGFSEARGRCVDHAKRKCECSSGWEGRQCQKRSCAGGCNGHGTCVKGKCVCDGAWTGTDCSQPRECPNGCNGHGQCRFGTCYCDEGPLGYHGIDCAYPNDNGNRNYRSKATKGSKAATKTLPWTQRPRVYTCDPPCGQHGKCLPLDANGAPIAGNAPADAELVCFCESGYVGATCEQLTSEAAAAAAAAAAAPFRNPAFVFSDA